MKLGVLTPRYYPYTDFSGILPNEDVTTSYKQAFRNLFKTMPVAIIIMTLRKDAAHTVLLQRDGNLTVQHPFNLAGNYPYPS